MTQTIRVILIFSMLTCYAPPLLAGPYEVGVNALQTKDYETAYRLFKQEAERGNTEAMMSLAHLLSMGKPFPKNEPAATSWMKQAALAGNPDAMSPLGFRLARGNGVLPNIQEAISWWQKGAKMGDTDCQWYLARWYNGFVSPGIENPNRDLIKSYVWASIYVLSTEKFYSTKSNSSSFDKETIAATIVQARKFRDDVSAALDFNTLKFAQSKAARCSSSGFTDCD